MKKWTFAALWAALMAALTTVPAYADLIIPGQPRPPRPTPPAPVPDPTPAQPDTALLTVLIAAVAVIAAAVLVWAIARRRARRGI